MNKIVRFFSGVILMLALLSYWVQPAILFTALPVGILALIIRRKKYNLIVTIQFTIIILFTIIIVLFLLLFKALSPPHLITAKYFAKGKYVPETQTIELTETLGFRNQIKQIHYPIQISLSQFIAVNVLNDSSLINHDLKSIVFTSGFQEWLYIIGWKFYQISDGNDLTLWLYRTKKIKLGEKWYRPKFRYTIKLPESPFYLKKINLYQHKSPFGHSKLIPAAGSELLLDMPSSMVRATSPPTVEKSFGIDYERLKIPVENERSITLEILSWPWRSKILINLSRLILWNPFMWFIGILSAIFADKLKDIISGKLWKVSS